VTAPIISMVKTYGLSNMVINSILISLIYAKYPFEAESPYLDRISYDLGLQEKSCSGVAL